jgi:hypothetical protein
MVMSLPYLIILPHYARNRLPCIQFSSPLLKGRQSADWYVIFPWSTLVLLALSGATKGPVELSGWGAN